MKQMKRLLCLALAAVLTLLLSICALAAHAVVSAQKLEVDGWAASAQPYNIDGYNYFKLRDIAALLRGTDARFDVGFDPETDSITVTTGEKYRSVGGELAPLEDGDREAVDSAQTLWIDGEQVSDIKAYNIDGYNYFKIRDLGKALGFDVSYDQPRNTVIIATARWAPAVTFTTADTTGRAWTESCFANHRLTLLNRWSCDAPACLGEMPALQRIAEEYAARGVQVLGLYDAKAESESIAKLAELGVTYPCLRYTAAFDAYMDKGYYPVTLLIDCYGRVVDQIGGSLGYDDWARELDRILDGNG